MEWSADEAHLAHVLQVLASPVRLSLLRRLQEPAFVRDLVRDCGLTRQALRRHLDDLVDAGFVAALPSRRHGLPATRYGADAAGLFACRESLADLAIRTDPELIRPHHTRPMPGGDGAARQGTGLALVHGDRPGRWFPLGGRQSAIIGRDPRSDVPLPYDAFASGRNALLHRDPGGWTLTDLHSTNGTRLNFCALPPGRKTALAAGDILTVGRSHLVLQEG